MKTNFINKLKIIIILVTISINIFFSFYMQSLANTKLADSDTTTSTSDNKIQNLSIYSDEAILMDSKTGKIIVDEETAEMYEEVMKGGRRGWQKAEQCLNS